VPGDAAWYGRHVTLVIGSLSAAIAVELLALLNLVMAVSWALSGKKATLVVPRAGVGVTGDGERLARTQAAGG